MNYTLRQLRTFVAVAQQGSFSQAGQAIGLSQSAVSHSIKELEAEMGVRLLDRTTRDVDGSGASIGLAPGAFAGGVEYHAAGCAQLR